MNAIKKDNWVLVTMNGKPVHVGDTVLDFRGDAHKVEGGQPPHKPSSTGRIHTDLGEFFPSVVDCRWIKQD